MKKVIILVTLLFLSCGKKEQQQNHITVFPDPPMIKTKVEVPNLELPDSLGGKRAKGWIGVITTFTLQGKLLHYEIDKIKISMDTTGPRILYSIYDGVTTEDAVAEMRRYTQWVDLYLQKATFKIMYDTSYYKFHSEDTLHGGIIIRLNPDK